MIRDRITDNGTLFPALRQGIPGPAGAPLVRSETPPADTASVWFDTTTSILSVWYVDAWVATNAVTTTTPDGAYVNGSGNAYVNGSGAYYINN